MTGLSSHGVFAGLLRRGALLLALLLAVLQPAMAWADSVQYLYDPGGRLIAVLDPVNGAAQYTYDKAGNITAIARIAPTTVTALQFYPTRATVGTTITISGTGFGTIADTTVKFSATTAIPTAVTPNSITVAVPTGATSGVLTVTAPNGTATTATSFTVAGPVSGPAITSFSPTTQMQGQSVTITGARFDTTSSKVYVNGQSAQITAATTTSISFNVPIASSGKVVVQTPVGTATSTADLIIPPPPYVTTAIGGSARTSLDQPAVTVAQGGSSTVSLVLFDVTAGQVVNARLDATGNPGCLAPSVLGPNGATVFPTTSVCNTAAWTGPLSFPQAGTYTLQVVPSAGSGSFGAQVISVPPDANAALSTTGVTKGISITKPGQHGVFTFTATAGQAVSVLLDFTNLAPNCGTYAILDPQGGTVVGATRICGRVYVSSTPVALALAGTYSIVIAPELRNGVTDGTGQISGTVFAVPADVTAAISGGGRSSLVIATPGQHGNFTFSGTAGQSITLLLDNTQMSGCVQTVLLNPDSSVLVASTSVCGRIYLTGAPISLPQTGTYTITLVPALGGNTTTSGTGQATATLFAVPADVATSAAVGGPATPVALTTPGQRAQITFSGTSGQSTTLLVDNTQLSGCVRAALLNPDGSTLVASTYLCGRNYLTGAPIALAQTGTYSLLLTPDLGGNLPTSGVGLVVTTLFLVPADVTASATIGGTVAALDVVTPGQHAKITFSGTSAQKLALLLDDSQASDCASISVLNPDNSVLIAPTRWCSSGYVNGAPIALPQTGTYTLTIAPELGSNVPVSGTGWFAATLFAVPADVAGTAAIGGTTSTIQVTVPEQHAKFTFTATAGQIVALLFDTSQLGDGCASAMAILNPDSSVLVPARRWCGSALVNAPLTLPQTGTYSLTIMPELTGTRLGGTGAAAVTIAPSS